MAITEILNTKNEQFIIFEDGRISCKKLTKEEKKVIKPTEPLIFDVYPKPKEPKPTGWMRVEFNIWGEEISRDYENIREWRILCYEIDEKNKAEHKKQRKAFKKHLIEVRKAYYLQEYRRQKERARISLIPPQSVKAFLKYISGDRTID